MLNLLILAFASISLVVSVLVEEPPTQPPLDADSFCNELTGGRCDQGWSYECVDESVTCDAGACSCLVTLRFTCNESCTPTDPYVLFSDDLRVKAISEIGNEIKDLAVLDGKLLGVKHSDTVQILELDPEDGSLVAVLHDFGPRGRNCKLTATQDGDLYVTSHVSLMRLSADGQQSVVSDGSYRHCRVGSDGTTVYALRVTEEDQPVLVDVVVGGAVVETITTQLGWTNRHDFVTCGATSEDNVLFIASTERGIVSKISLNNGTVLGTYGQKGTSGPGQLRSPRIGMTDGQEIIIADQTNHNLQVLNSADGSFYIVSIADGEDGQNLGHPRSVIRLADHIYVPMGGFSKYVAVLEKDF